MIQGLRTIIYHVNNLEKARAWYIAILGKKPYFDQPFYVGFNVGGFELGLQPDIRGTSWGTNTVAYWGVPDARKAYSELLMKGGIQHHKIQEVGEGILLGTVIDPCGNVFGVIENPNFKYEEEENFY
jgi:predicted enzyme related to lactoylglutathione lyase